MALSPNHIGKRIKGIEKFGINGIGVPKLTKTLNEAGIHYGRFTSQVTGMNGSHGDVAYVLS